MGIITEIKLLKGKKARESIYVDGQYVCCLDSFTIFKNRLKIGTEITDGILEQICIESEMNSAFDLSLQHITKYSKTKQQLKDFIIRKGYLPKIAQRVIEKLEDYHYINDEAFARAFIDNSCNKCGKKKLKYELLQKGISEEIIEKELDALQNQQEIVYNLAVKYMNNKEFTPQNLQKLMRHLAGKGFDWENINSVVSQLKRANKDD